MKLLVDYAAHPAFRDLVLPGGRNLVQARTYFDALDDAWRESLAAPVDGLRRFEQVQENQVRKLTAER